MKEYLISDGALVKLAEFLKNFDDVQSMSGTTDVFQELRTQDLSQG